jgi:hypothetical protein
MAPPATSEKLVALNALYGRIASIAAAMGGKAAESSANLRIPGIMVASPRNEAAPALVVEMPDRFRVDFAPTHPLTIENALAVRAVRTHEDLRKTDWQFNLGSDGWQRTQAPLSDDEIRQCLTPEGPRPAIY